jgi:plasmid stability protein
MEDVVADLLIRGVEDALVLALKKRAGAHGRSQEAELRAILAAALQSPPRRNLADLLAAMPDVGVDADFQRPNDRVVAADIFD